MAATQRKSCSKNLPIAWDTKSCFYYSIQPLVSSESAPSSLHVTTPQDMEVNLASSYSCFPPADFVHSQIPASSAPVYLGSDSEHSQVPISFQYDLDDFTSQGEDIFSLTYDPSYHFLLPSPSRSSSTQAGRLSMEHSVEPYQRWLPVDMNTHNSLIPQPSILSYVSNASPTFPGPCNPDNGIYAEIAGSSHLTMTRTVSESANDGTGTTLVPFPTYNANNYCMWLAIVFPSTFLWITSMSLLPQILLLTTMLIPWYIYVYRALVILCHAGSLHLFWRARKRDSIFSVLSQILAMFKFMPL